MLLSVFLRLNLSQVYLQSTKYAFSTNFCQRSLFFFSKLPFCSFPAGWKCHTAPLSCACKCLHKPHLSLASCPHANWWVEIAVCHADYHWVLMLPKMCPVSTLFVVCRHFGTGPFYFVFVWIITCAKVLGLLHTQSMQCRWIKLQPSCVVVFYIKKDFCYRINLHFNLVNRSWATTQLYTVPTLTSKLYITL